MNTFELDKTYIANTYARFPRGDRFRAGRALPAMRMETNT